MTVNMETLFWDHWSPQGSVPAQAICELVQQRHFARVSAVSLTKEDRLPYIEIGFRNITHPSMALAIGREIAEATGMPVWLHGVRPESATFYLEGTFLLESGKSCREGRFEEVGVPLALVEAVWNAPPQ